MPYFNIVAETNENTVVTEYKPVRNRSDGYHSEAALEQELIRLLCEQGYDYLPIHTEADLIANLRAKLEELNDYNDVQTEKARYQKRTEPTETLFNKLFNKKKFVEENGQIKIGETWSPNENSLLDRLVKICDDVYSLGTGESISQTETLKNIDKLIIDIAIGIGNLVLLNHLYDISLEHLLF